MTDQPSLKARIQDDMKNAMRNKDARRLGVIRLMLAAMKQREVDERIVLDDPSVLAILDKMMKQRRDSESQYRAAARADLAEQEAYEIQVIQEFLPAPLTAAELDALITAAVQKAGAASARDMGKVMALLRDQVQGRADMAAVGGAVKAKLSG